MSIRGWLVALLFMASVAGPAAAAPIEAYGGLPSIEAIEISPDGSKLAIAMSTGEQRMLGIKPLPAGPMETYGVGKAKVRRLDWFGSERVIVTTSDTQWVAGLSGPRREWLLGFDLDVATHKTTPLLSGSPGRGQIVQRRASERVTGSLNVLAGPPEVHMIGGTPTLFLRGITFPADTGVLTILKVDLKTHRTEITELGVIDTDDFVLGQDGIPLARTDYDDKTGKWVLRLRQDNTGWKVNRSLEAKTGPPFLAGLGRDGRSVIVGEMAEAGFQVREVAVDGTWGEPLELRDFDAMIHDPLTHRMIGYHALVGDEDRYSFFDPADQKAWNAVLAAFKGDLVQLESWSQDRKKIVVLVDSPTEGPAYALVDLTTKRADWLFARYQKLKEKDISPVRPIRFKAKDGTELSGYLTAPYGAQAKNLPLVVFPHGGPASRDTPGFDWWAQAMASRGYAVLQVNFRGSDGYGWPFLSAGFGEWGGKMQTDLSDGVRHLAAEGVIDPKRVCIVGASYGGYAALAGATLDTGVYRCAASYGGVSDLRKMVAWSKLRSQESFRYWIRFMGAETGKDQILTERSPAARADQVSIPVLLIHGQDDSVVPLEQSRVMAEALQKAGKPVELLVLKGEDHWLSRGETRTQTLSAMIAFLEKHNPPN